METLKKPTSCVLRMLKTSYGGEKTMEEEEGEEWEEEEGEEEWEEEEW
jgi:hypothetical protein